jgi:arginase
MGEALRSIRKSNIMNHPATCILVGAPVQEGAGRLGCDMGPSAFRTAGLAQALEGLGFRVEDWGNLVPLIASDCAHPNPVIKNLPAIAAWTVAIEDAAFRASAHGMPIFLGGDHAVSAGSITGMSRRAAEEGKPLFVLWLDSHPDFHTLESTTSGHLHGVPMAYAMGRPGFTPYFPYVTHPLDPHHVCMMGIRSVDPAERAALRETGMTIHDMRAIDEHGVATLLDQFLRRVADAGGRLHVSLDVDFLDPNIAPGVGTTVPGGATFREAHLIMEILSDSGLVGSLDLVELNPFLDERGRTALLLVDLVASLMGRRVLDRPTQSFQTSPGPTV